LAACRAADNWFKPLILWKNRQARSAAWQFEAVVILACPGSAKASTERYFADAHGNGHEVRGTSDRQAMQFNA
jgi:hypothetical protein